MLGFVSLSCERSVRYSSVTPQLKAGAERTANKANTVSYQGIHFTFDPSLTSEVKSETISAYVDGKPSDIVPEHPAFTLVGYPSIKKHRDDSPHLRVFRISAFRDAFRLSSSIDARRASAPTDWTPYFEEEIRTLNTLFDRKPESRNLIQVVSKARSDQNNTQMPFLPMCEAQQAFIGHLKYVRFKNGRGVLFLTQWNTETEQVTNEGLEYAFQGITDDGQYHIYAEFSVASPTLPTGLEPEVQAWNEKNYLLSHKSKEYQRYLRPVLKKLEALPANQFQPNLELLEKLVESLQIEIESYQ